MTARAVNEDEERLRRALNVRVKGFSEEEGEDLAKVLEPLRLDLSKVSLGKREGNKKSGSKRHIVLSCSDEEVKRELLEKNEEEELKKLGVSIIEDLTPAQMSEVRRVSAATEEERTVYLSGVMELYGDADDRYMLEYLLRKLADTDEECSQLLDGIKHKRIGGSKKFGFSRILRIIFSSNEAKDLIMSKREKLFKTNYFLDDERLN